jgi:hypothetical protein
MHVSRQGDFTLRIEFSNDSGEQVILIPDFEEKQIYFSGDAEITFQGVDRSDFNIAQPDGSWSSAAEPAGTVSPFENLDALSERTSGGVIHYVYELRGSSDRQFHMMNEINGQEVTQWRINAQDDDLILVARNREGEDVARFVLRGGNTEEIRNEMEIHLNDEGARVESFVDLEIHGGDGDDLIHTIGGAGSRVYGHRGSDMIVINAGVGDEGAVVEGNEGDDIIQGGGQDDRLSGGEGRDFIYGGLGTNVLEGGMGNDALFTANTAINATDEEIISGGDGLDISNAWRGEIDGIETGIEDLNGLMAYLDQWGANGASPIVLQQIINAEEVNIPSVMAMISEELEGLALTFLDRKDQERQSWYNPLPGDPNYGYQPTVDTSDPGQQGYQSNEQSEQEEENFWSSGWGLGS